MTGLVRVSSLVFHIVENGRQALFVESGILGSYSTAGAGVAVGIATIEIDRFSRPSGT